jgi:hypothetical protein
MKQCRWCGVPLDGDETLEGICVFCFEGSGEVVRRTDLQVSPACDWPHCRRCGVLIPRGTLSAAAAGRLLCYACANRVSGCCEGTDGSAG